MFLISLLVCHPIISSVPKGTTAGHRTIYLLRLEAKTNAAKFEFFLINDPT